MATVFDEADDASRRPVGVHSDAGGAELPAGPADAGNSPLDPVALKAAALAGPPFFILPKDEWQRRVARACEVIDTELARAGEGPLRDMLMVTRRIATGELKRPIYGEATSRPMIAALAGLNQWACFEDRVKPVLDRVLPLLDHVFGYVMRKGTGDALVPTKPVLAALLEDLRDHLREGGLLPRSHRNMTKVSLFGVAEMFGFEPEDLASDTQVRKLIEFLPSIPGVLGVKWDASSRKADTPAHLEKTIAWLDARFGAHEPLPEDEARPGKPDHKAIRRAVDPDGPSVMHHPAYMAAVARHMAEGAPGVVDVGRVVPPAGPTAEEVATRIQDALADERRRAGKNPAGGRHELKTALGRALEARGIGWSDPWPSDLLDDLKTLKADAAEVGRALSESSARNLSTQLDIVARFAPAVTALEDGLPLAAHECLREAVLKSGKTFVELEAATQVEDANLRMPAALLSSMCLGARTFPQRYWQCLPLLEAALGTNGALARRWRPDMDVRNLACSDYFRSLRKKVRALLPKDAWRLDDDALRALVEERKGKALRQDTMYSKCCRASREVMRHVPKIPKGSRIRREIALLVKHKTAAVPKDARRRANASWLPATVRMRTKRLELIGRFAMLSRERGGLGMSAESLSLSLLLSWQVMAAFLNWRAGRFADVEHNGERRGPVLTTEDIATIGTAVSLLDPYYGFITQREDVFKPGLRADDYDVGEYHWLEEIRVSRRRDEDEQMPYADVFDDAFSTASVDRQVAPAELVALARTDWMKACVEAHNRLSNLRSYLTKLVDKSRDPFDVIRVVVYSQTAAPLDFVRDIVRAAAADLPDRRTKPVEHALAVRDLLSFTLTAVTALRSRNIRRLTYDPVGGGNVSFTKDGVLLDIPWTEFKNLGSQHLFGDWSNKMDYQRLVKDWYDIDAMFQHYLAHCRPVLIAHWAKKLRTRAARRPDEPKPPQDTKALFPAPGLKFLTAGGFHDVFKQLTARYHVVDPGTGMVRPGYMAFGPHAMRDIVAMHIILASDDESRWEEAADLLQTSPDMVRYRYTKRLVVDRTGKADRHFDASSKGMPPLVFA